jgi:predicted lipid-binding transport protein (Tim44 family)
VNVLAQQAADDTGQTVTLIIFGLLIVALLLAILTFWYWRHTDPRARLQGTPDAGVPRGGAHRVSTASVAGGSTVVASPTPAASGHAVVGRDSIRQSSPGAASGAVTRSSDRPMPEFDDEDDWLRLTGPQALRRDPHTA